MKTFYIIKGINSSVMMQAEDKITLDPKKAKRFNSIGEAMEFAIKINELLGHSIFRVFPIYD